MCGIFGMIVGSSSSIKSSIVLQSLERLLKLSQARGTESAGFALVDGDSIFILKEAIKATELIKTKQYRKLISQTQLNEKWVEKPLAFIGHSRLATNGSQRIFYNNQPVIKDRIIGVHNGIIVNDDDLWKSNPKITREYEIDTEVILSLLRMNLEDTNSIPKALKMTYNSLVGNASIGLLFSDYNTCALATDCGSLYTVDASNNSPMIFASENYILRQFAKHRELSHLFEPSQIRQVQPQNGLVVDLQNLNTYRFQLTDSMNTDDEFSSSIIRREIVDFSSQEILKMPSRKLLEPEDMNLLFERKEAIKELKRCTKCILPETFPFITFNEKGVCNYCESYDLVLNRGMESMKRILDNYRSNNDAADCLVMLSGGRDSSYALHYLKEELDMNPVAYTYDWGMVTDIARRNIARMCGQLGVEHILVSADIRKKRQNIRQNILAWMKNPVLGMVPLFMAGDKHWYYYANLVAKQLDLNLVVLSTNDLERTHFKVGFCGIPPITDKERRSGDLKGRVKLTQYYFKEMLKTPSYFNSSIIDTITAFLSFYQLPKNYLRFYEHYRWQENIIESTLIDEYGWETDSETPTTWRIGDGTAQFYNYIYYTIAGFTENDTFRSNQIREGLINREDALMRVHQENIPRYRGIKWYLSVNGLGTRFNDVIRTINSVPKLYPT